MKIDFSNFYDMVNKAYWPLVEDKSRFQILRGGSGSGKSHFIAQDEIQKQIFEKGTNLLITRQTGKSNRTSTFPLMRQVLYGFGASDLFHVRETDMVMKCKHNGNEIRFGGLDDVEKVKSMTFTNGPLTRIWMEEASENKEEDFNQLDLRLRGQAKVPFQMRLSFNPISSMHWLKSRFYDSQIESAHTFKLLTTYKDNQYIDPVYASRLENLANVDKTFYDVYCLGKWGTFGNIIFTNWVEEPCPYNEEDFDEVLSGMDFGFNHPLAIEKIGMKDGEMWSFDELYVREKTNREVIDLVDNESGPITKQHKCVADSAEPARIKEWKKCGFKNVVPAIKGKDSVSRGIDYLKSRKWHVDPDKCPGLLAELQSYSYKKDRDGNKTDEPVNYKDDAIAAVRYAVESHSRGRRKVFFESRK